MSLMYKKGDAKISLIELIYIYPTEWNHSVKHIVKWLDSLNGLDNCSIIDLIAEITEVFEEAIYNKYQKYNDENVWHYDDTSTIDETDVIRIMSTI